TDVIASRCLRWVHLTSAGYTRYDREEVRAALGQRGGMMTNSSSVYADPCAQHVLAFMLAHNRRLPSAIDAQRSGGDWAYPALRPTARVLSGQSVLLVGFGAIGRRLADLLAPFGAAILAVRRHPTGTEPVPTVSVDRLNASLPQADHVVNLLPSAAGTEKMFDAGRFALMHPKAAFYNVGRGDTVDQDALLEALTCGRLAAAYLDVTSPEPLPRNHPLWNAPNCVITPHIAGGVQDEPQRLVDHFLANFARFVAGEPLHDRII
ncbi:MAG: D-2-hydroxyacid dehydrogenase, partial [Phycisphaerae bacterium]|nr:D-2-hydroxyacid dehydrogenase [Phycisphaerae bacterium]